MSTNELTLTEDKKKTIALKITTYVVSILLTFMILTPLYYFLRQTFLEEVKLVHGAGDNTQLVITPREHMITLKEFAQLFTAADFIGFRNSMLVTCTSTLLNMYFSALTAYAITAYQWKLRQAFEKFIIVAMMIPSTVASIGFVQMCYKFHLINNLIMLIIPALATPMTVFFIRMYLKATFSKEIVESARLDGAGEFRIFNQIMLPLMKPAIATQTIFCFVASWTDEWVPRIILIDNSKNIKTLPLMGSIQGAGLLMLIPPVILYALLSKHIVEGIALGSVKA
ncbi:multiple sugar transport system permease protein [Ruminococcaceae bacterium R-25]|nr:multiple sugar transport system permease protein [Ruminococcaceae bacterium R-25]SUQ21620.1 multiple sugar transport system permease protein [Oscillospiraceae bacterium]